MNAETNVLVNLLIYLAAMVIVVPLAKRFGLGVVLGYLLAGFFIGPFGLGLSGNSQSIHSLAELGIVLMLFTIGLELNLNRLWGMRNLVFGFGAFQMVTCGIIFTILLLIFGLSVEVSFILGLTLALSSTAVAIQLMNDRKLLDTKAGRTIFGVLLFQDIAAIPILISVSIFFPNAATHKFNFLYAVGAVLGLVLIGKYLLGYALRWIAQNGSRELFVGAALLLVIAVMELMATVGVSAGLGAFIAGVLLASSEYRHELEADLEPFKGLFLGLFFITIGSSIDIQLLIQNWPMILALLALFLVVKLTLLYFQARILKMPRRERLVFSGILGQGSEFGFVVIALGSAGQMISLETGGWLNLVIALSIGLSPLIMKAHDHYVNRFLITDENKPEMDRQMDHTEVLIAGFGRFGQIVGRVLLSSGIPSTILDHDSEHIESMRQFGFKIYYGDAKRLDLLEAAGAGKAKILIVAVDDKETSIEIVKLAQKNFPHLKIIARANDVPHLYD